MDFLSEGTYPPERLFLPFVYLQTEGLRRRDLLRRVDHIDPSMESSSTGVDLISSLCEDLLLNVIGLLPSAADVVRTSALSRRWCRLWTRAPTLRFPIAITNEYLMPAVDAPRMIGVIDAVLAGRAAGADVGNLEISFLSRRRNNQDKGPAGLGYSLRRPHATHVDACLRYGARHAVKSFLLEVLAPETDGDAAAAGEVPDILFELALMPLDEDDNKVPLELPGSWRAEAVRLHLAKRSLKLPAEASFHALTDLQLDNFGIDDGGDQRRLGRLVSSPCCPRLRRLRITHVSGLQELALRSGTLEELVIFATHDLQRLDVDAPRLRMLDAEYCFCLSGQDAEMTIAAPNLEVLACDNVCPPEGLQLDGALSVRRIEKLQLDMYSDTDSIDHADNESGMWLLKKCTGVNHLHLILFVPELQDGNYEEVMRGMPKLANVTTLDIEVCSCYGHRYVPSLANLLAMCPRLQYLHIEAGNCKPECSNPGCICRGPASWRSREIPLEHLREVEITGVSGWEDETSSLVKLLFASAAAVAPLERMTLKFEPYKRDGGRKARELALELSAGGGRGRWTVQADDSNGVCLCVWTMN